MEFKRIIIKNYHLIIFGMLLIIALLISFNSIVNQNDLKMDFRSFFYAGKLVEKDINIYDFSALNNEDEKKEHVYPFVYTPIVAQFFSLFSNNNPLNIQLLWSVLNILLIPLIFYLSFQLLDKSKQIELLNKYSLMLLIIPIVILMFAPFRYIIIIGQIDLFILMLLLISLNMAKSGKDSLAGSVFAMAIMLKYSGGLLLLYFLFQKKYKFILSFIISFIIIFLISYLFNPEQWINLSEFLINTFQIGVPGLPEIGDVANSSIFSLPFKIFGESNLFSKLMIIGILCLSFYLIFFQIRKMNYKDEELVFLLPFLVLTIISTPYTWRQHFIYLMPGILVLSYYILLKFDIKRTYIFLSILFVLLFLTGFNFSSKILELTSNQLLASHNLISGLILIIFTFFVYKSSPIEKV